VIQWIEELLEEIKAQDRITQCLGAFLLLTLVIGVITALIVLP
jgi:hypothetical protein